MKSNMLWNENDNVERNDSVQDLIFSISCKSLPVDHAFPLSQAIQAIFPWFADEQQAGMHQIHIMESGHGWSRPSGNDAVLLLSRRTKFILRLPQHRIEEAQTLTGKTLDVDGHALTINSATLRPMSELTTLIARYVVTEGEEEDVFSRNVIDAMELMGIKPKKMLCGIEKIITIERQAVATRSLMVAELNEKESLLLQQQGLGSHLIYGCGLFVPQKNIAEI